MKSQLRAAVLILSALLLSSCQRPYYTWIVNSSDYRVLVLHASWLGFPDGENVANASPWWLPISTTPVLDYAEAYRLTSYSLSDGWRIEIQLVTGCKMWFSIPGIPENAYERPDWQIYTAYGEAALQFNNDNRIYRLPAHSRGNPADVTRLPQPEGYPLAPTESDC